MRRSLLVLALLLPGACGQRIHLVGRVATDGPDGEGAPAGGPDGGDRARPDGSGGDAEPPPGACRPDGVCSERQGTRCLVPCAWTDAAVTTCVCEEGRWTSCSTELIRCATADGCMRSDSCQSSPSSCDYCDSARLRVVACSCDSAGEWRCEPLPIVCE